MPAREPGVMATESGTHLPWDPRNTYVVGHQRPDTDAIGSALGYAWYLSATGLKDVVSARAGQVGRQALFALERFGQPQPTLLTSVSPTFRHVAEPQETVLASSPVWEAVRRLKAGVRMVPVVGATDRPLGGVGPSSLVRHYGSTPGEPGGPGGDFGSVTCQDALEELPVFRTGDRISDFRASVLRSDSDDYLVTDEQGVYAGLATRQRILGPPRAELVLVDHNELSQAVHGADEARIVAVLDHHRLGNPATALPISFVVEPVGSASTLVGEQCRASSLEPPAGIAGMLLSGLLSDTLVLRSPTTTERDRTAALWLAALCGEDVARYGEELLLASPGLLGRSPDEIIDADRKAYQMGGRTVSIGQVEVSGLQELPELLDGLLAALADRRDREGLALSSLMVTDVVTGRSRLLCQADRQIASALPFPRLSDYEYDLGPIVSRKKQLVPVVHSLLEGTS
jgi:manganese-dependent inorganic pyrophosphatase